MKYYDGEIRVNVRVLATSHDEAEDLIADIADNISAMRWIENVEPVGQAEELQDEYDPE